MEHEQMTYPEALRWLAKKYNIQIAERELSEEEWIVALATHPILIERPIVVSGERAVVGRPPEKALELLDTE